MLGGAGLGRVPLRGFGHPVGEVLLEPAAPFGTQAQVAAGLAEDPGAQVDPVADLVRALAEPGHVLAQVAVGLGGVAAEAAQHLDPHLLRVAVDRVALVRLQQLAGDVAATVQELDVPGLVVDAGRAVVQLLGGNPQRVGDLGVAALHAVAEADRGHAPVPVGGPGEHRHRVRVVEEPAAGLGSLADVLAERQDHRDAALAVHDAAGAQGVAHALVDAVAQRHLDVGGERRQSADARGAEHVARPAHRLPLVQGAGEAHAVPAVGFDVAPHQPLDHRQVLLADVHEGDVDAGELGDGEDVPHQLAGEPDTAGADERHLE